MNERIRQLKIQACKWASENASSAEYENAADQKFAELIVGECADIANKQFSAASGLDDRDSWTAVEIKKHFGVEE